MFISMSCLYSKYFVKFCGVMGLVSVLCNCTYDRALIYKENYSVGTSILLRFDGFYVSSSQINETEFIYPVFFYRDGSVILMGAIKDTN
jgi:hypothetical protein